MFYNMLLKQEKCFLFALFNNVDKVAVDAV